MIDNDQLLKQIGNLIATKLDEKLDPITKDLHDVKTTQQEQRKKLSTLLHEAAHTNTAIKTLSTRQDVEAAKTELKADIKKVRTEMATKADILDVGVKIDKMKRRIEILQEDADLPNPHKN